MHDCIMLAALACVAVVAANASPLPGPAVVSDFNVEWLAPSLTPGTTVAGKETYIDAMPLGNGRTTVRLRACVRMLYTSALPCVWPQLWHA